MCVLLWLKAFHVVFLVTWFAGLFYLPRLFVYHVAATDSVTRNHRHNWFGKGTDLFLEIQNV